MADSSAPASFEWVHSTTAILNEDVEVRTRIRKQAMKRAAAERRKRGNYGQHNLLQYEVSQTAQSDLTDKAFMTSAHATGKVSQHNHNLAIISRNKSSSIPASISQRGYELKSTENGFNILDLSVLTSADIGRASGQLFRKDSSQLLLLLRHRQSSYFTHVPARYGHSACLTDAINCVLSRMRQIISQAGDRLESTVMLSYTKALRSLQTALDSPIQRFDPEVLCATEILSIYELLSTSEENLWTRHASGAACLIRLRGPERYQSEFEKRLFMAYSGPIAVEALLDNEHCFLEQRSWNSLLRSMIIPNNNENLSRSEVFVSLLCNFVRIPGLLSDATRIVYKQCDSMRSSINDVTSRARQLRSDLCIWWGSYHHTFSQIDCLSKKSPEYDQISKALVIYYTAIIFHSRILTSISTDDILLLEAETQRLAQKIIDITDGITSILFSPQLSLASQKVAIARATKLTEKKWLEERKGDGSEQQIASVETFQLWCNLFGRKTT